MRKFIIVISLVLIDILAYIYFKNIYLNRIEYPYSIVPQCLVYQISDIKLHEDEEFKFDKYFKLTSSNYKYKYELLEHKIKIELENKEYFYDYEIIKPEVIEKIVYKEANDDYKKEIVNNEKDSNENEYYIYDNNDNIFRVNNNYLKFELNSDLNIIRQALVSNLVTTKQASIDYSRLNVSQIGQYNVFYISEDEEIEIIIEIY